MNQLPKMNGYEDIKNVIFEILSITEFVAPIGSLLNRVKFNRFDKRLKENEKKVKRIFGLIAESDYEFFIEKLGLPVFEKILSDEEDDKAEFFLLGFENCVSNEIKDQELMIYYFDLLSDLRMVDLKRLVSIVENDIFDVTKLSHNDKNFIIRATDEKLRQKGLIEANISWSSASGESIRYDNPDFKLTKKGLGFMKFLGY